MPWLRSISVTPRKKPWLNPKELPCTYLRALPQPFLHVPDLLRTVEGDRQTGRLYHRRDRVARPAEPRAGEGLIRNNVQVVSLYLPNFLERISGEFRYAL